MRKFAIADMNGTILYSMESPETPDFGSRFLVVDITEAPEQPDAGWYTDGVECMPIKLKNQVEQLADLDREFAKKYKEYEEKGGKALFLGQIEAASYYRAKYNETVVEHKARKEAILNG
jgi:hypothetical protein